MNPMNVREHVRGRGAVEAEVDVEDEDVRAALESLNLGYMVGSVRGVDLAATKRNVPLKRPARKISIGSPEHASNSSLIQDPFRDRIRELIRSAREYIECGNYDDAIDEVEAAVYLMSNSTPLDSIREAEGLIQELYLEGPGVPSLLMADDARFRDHLDSIWGLHLFLGAVSLSRESFRAARLNCMRAVRKVAKEHGAASSQTYDALQFQAVVRFACNEHPEPQKLLSKLPLDRHAETYEAMRQTQMHYLLSKAQWDKLINLSMPTSSRESIEDECSAPSEPWPPPSLLQSSHRTNRGSDTATERSKDETALPASSNDRVTGNQSTHSPPPSTICNSGSEGERSFIAGSIIQTHDILPRNIFEENTWQFINAFASYFVDRCISIAGTYVPTSFAPSQVQSSSSGSQANTEATEITSRSFPLKRNRSRHDLSGGKDEEGDGEPRKSKELKPGSAAKVARIFACPYAKFDRQRYSEQNQEEKCYRGCASNYLRDISRVKQHLYRTHKRPDWYCPICYDSFKTREILNVHLQERSCEAKAEKYEEMMTDEQYNAVKRRATGNNPRESWYQIFAMLFPDASRPLSPYVSSCNAEAVKHFVELFHSHGAEEFYNFLRDRREQSETFVPLGPSTQAIVDEAFEIALPDYLDRVSADRSPVDRETETSWSRKRPKTDNFTSAILPPNSSDSTVAPESAPVLGEPDIFTQFFDPSLLIASDGNDNDWPMQVDQQETVFDPAQIDPAFDAYAELLVSVPAVNPKHTPWAEDARRISLDGRYARAEGT